MKFKTKYAFSICLIMLFITGLWGQKRNIRNPRKILQQIDKMLTKKIALWTKGKNLTYPPSCTLIRFFKLERECEIWAKNDSMANMELVTTISVCKMDFKPGPKIIYDNQKTPEGFYAGEFSYNSDKPWMWMVLTEAEVDKWGIPGTGSCFRLFVTYPNRVDRNNTLVAGKSNSGGAIFIHGNCVSTGCLSFSNRNYMSVFAFARHHNAKSYGTVQIHIFPFRYNQVDEKRRQQLASEYRYVKQLGQDYLLSFWNNLKEGYDKFNLEKNIFKVRIINHRIFRVGSVSAVVQEIKQKLHDLGLFKGKIDQNFRRDLRNAVRNYQHRHNLTIDGVAGPKTLRSLGIPSLRYKFE